MGRLAKLIYRAHVSYLPTAFPAHYYGMPNGKVYLVFSRLYRGKAGQNGLEFVFAEHLDYDYDYERDVLHFKSSDKRHLRVFAEHVDQPRIGFNVISISRKLNSYGEAQVFLNQTAKQMKQYA